MRSAHINFKTLIRTFLAFAGAIFLSLFALAGVVPVFAADEADLPELKVMKETETEEKPEQFYKVLEKALTSRKMRFNLLCDQNDAVAQRILREYGSVFIARENVAVPPVCIFTSHEEVDKFQSSFIVAVEQIDGAQIELQLAAMLAYREAREEAQKAGLDITPRDGAEAARRNFADTLRLWNSRFLPACDYWLEKGKLTEEEVLQLKALPIKEQVKSVLEYEQKGIFFNTWFNNSILYSVAPPGTSQHLMMLAFDANEYADERVREILARHGWFRTVRNDEPHFTFLGHKEKDLKKFGLKKLETERGKFYIPNI